MWGWEDVALLMGAILPAVFVGSGLMRLLRWLFPRPFAIPVVTTLTFQLFIYGLLLGALFLLLSRKYGEHSEALLASLGFKLAFPGAIPSLLAGPVLAVAISLLGVAIHTPDVRDPIREMITGRTSLALVIVFGVLIAPFVEELFFRGFLLPLIAQVHWDHQMSIIITAILLLSLPHGAQNAWAWQQLVLIALAGVAFGFARYRTGSTSAAYLVHAGYNATQFLGFLFQQPS